MKKTLISTLIFFSMFGTTQAEVQSKKQFNLPKINKDIILDGKLSEAHWQQALKVPLNYVVSYELDNAPSPVETTAYVYEDDEYLYVGFDAKDDDVSEIRGAIRDRDLSVVDDSVGIKIDTFNTQKNAYSFFVNAGGSQNDMINTERGDRESNYSWDAIWSSKAVINEGGYTVEMKIPLSTFSFDDSKNIQDWGVLFMRFYPRDQFYKMLSAEEDRGNICMLCQMDTMTGLEGTKKGNDLRITPSLVYTNNEHKDAGSWSSDDDFKESLDVRWGVTSNTLVNFTYNPDFSSVEVDSGTLSVNERFSIYTPEKRQFFTEDSNNFNSLTNLIHTRNIIDPNYGLKITGTEDKHSFGLFYVDDNKSIINVVGNEMSEIAEMDSGSDNFAGRYVYNASESLDVGFTTTIKSNHNSDYQNILYSADASYDFSEYQGIKVQIGRSNTDYDENFNQQFEETELFLRTDDSASGSTYLASYWFESEIWKHTLELESADEGFRSDLGYSELSDFRKITAESAYITNLDGESFFYRYDTFIKSYYTENNDGDLISRQVSPGISGDGNMMFYGFVQFNFIEQVSGRIDVNDLSLGGNATYFNLEQIQFSNQFQPAKDLDLYYEVTYGDHIDYDNNRKAKGSSVYAESSYALGQNFEIAVGYDYLDLNYNGKSVLDAHLVDIRLKYHFNNNSNLKLTLIYNKTDRNADNYLFETEEKYSDIGSQLLYTYKVNPQTLAYLGYSDLRVKDDVYDNLTSIEKNYFAKLSYAFQM